MSPDLETVIRSDELTRERGREIQEASSTLADGFRVWSGGNWGFFRRRAFLEIPDLHDHLTDDADWNADTWAFDSEGRARLVRTLEWLYERLPEAFEFRATWGPITTDECVLERAELLSVIEDDRVATGTVYKVRSV